MRNFLELLEQLFFYILVFPIYVIVSIPFFLNHLFKNGNFDYDEDEYDLYLDKSNAVLMFMFALEIAFLIYLIFPFHGR